VLSGPNLAGEILEGKPAAAVVASTSTALAERIQRIATTPRFRVYTSLDVTGVEIGGSVKNIIAIAAGIAEGLSLGVNTRSVLITRGLAEMSRFAAALGGEPATLMGLSGLGDLITTCNSPKSRNFQAGLKLAEGRTREQIEGEMLMVAEGITTVLAIRRIAGGLGVDMPITEQVYRIVYENKPPRDAISDLMTRELRPETDD